jgi:outer membrane protein assembly factor BamB
LIGSAGIGQVTAQQTIPISWQFDTGTTSASIAAEDEVTNAVYILSEQTGTLFKISTSTGEEIWSISRPVSDESGASFRINFDFDSDSNEVTIQGNSGYLTTDDSIYAVSLATGDEQWEFSKTGEFSFIRRVTGESVYVQNSTSLRGLDPQTGNEKLIIQSELLDEEFTSEAAYIVDSLGTLSRFNNTNGTEEWSTSYDQQSSVESNRIFGVTDTAVYASINSTPRKIDVNTGEKLWSASQISSNPSQADLTENRLITVSESGVLNGVDSTTGTVEWTTRLDSNFSRYNVNVQRGNQLYIEANDRNAGSSVFQIDPSNGGVNWEFNSEGTFPFSFVNRDNQLTISANFFEDDNGILYGVNPATGSERWQINTNGFGPAFEINNIGYIANQSEVLGIDLTDGSTVVSRSFDERVAINRITNKTVYMTSGSTAYGLDADGLSNDGSGDDTTDSPLSGVAGEYDADNDGDITASELGDAVTDFGQGELTASELGEVVTAFGQS